MRCLDARRQCLTVEHENNALFECLATMLCPWSGEAMRC